MGTRVVNSPVSEPSVRGSSGLRLTYLAAGGFFLGMAIQALGYLALGTGQTGMAVSECIVVLHHLLAIVCVGLGVRRARGASALFWVLFLLANAILLIANIVPPVRAIFGQSLVSDSTWRSLYALYGAPVLMMLILPDSNPGEHIRTEIFLDLFQVALVVGLLFSTFFYLPLQQMLPAEALHHNFSISSFSAASVLTTSPAGSAAKNSS